MTEEQSRNEEAVQPVSPTQERREEAAQCGPGCACGKKGPGTKTKVIVCLLVAVAATGVLARSVMLKAENGTAPASTAFAAIAVAPSPAASPAAKATEKAASPLWGEPLKEMSALNKVAIQKDAVFVYLPKKGQESDESVRRQIENAAEKIQSKGTKMAIYALDSDSKDYAQITSQTKAPCVLALVRGLGASAVAGDIVEDKLIAAVVTASRPASSCCPSGGGASKGCK